jgi:hypothetical protein
MVDLEKGLLDLSLNNVEKEHFSWQLLIKRNKDLRRII